MEKKLKVLFVSSGNSKNFEIAPFIKAQGESLTNAGIEVNYFAITGKGFIGYLRGASNLRKHLKNSDCDIVHAHYTLSGWSAVLSFPRQPIVLSLMGDDAYGDFIGENQVRFSSYYLVLLTKLIQPFVAKLICKSKHIESYVYLKNKSSVIANGIRLENFYVQDKGYRMELGLDPKLKYVLFLGSKNSVRKNYKLAESAIKTMNDPDVRLISPFPITHVEVVKYLNSVNCLVVPSFMEGSPNVVKEAMSCNCPIVATDVGDVRWVIGDIEGCYTASFEPNDFADKLKLALKFTKEIGRTKGRERIIQLGLDAETVAKKIIEIYKKILN
jgi:glycosyltransferase involved in cell wall biosynthesis